MGKHERQLIEAAEKIIVKILNSQKLDDFDKKNQWFNHAIAIAEKIKKDFGKITFVQHLGNRYDNIGDIMIVSAGKKFFIEAKMSDTKSGIGTKANISQDALTENFLFDGSVKSWSEFRKEKNHEKRVMTYLNNFKKYPKKILNIKNIQKQKEEKARYLRDLKKRNTKARKILANIHKLDKEEKLGYLTYLSEQKQREEMIKRFFILITLGIHKKELIREIIKQNEIFKEIKNLYVYYSNISKNKINVRKEDGVERLKRLLKKLSNFNIVFPSGATHCKIVGIKNKKQYPLLQIVFHWKNIAQGIKTPCLNIFDLTN
ncbi:hypothetical protein HZB05_02590 [Candidatus Wolfebacteria bacterium]|nr:hypothetical protein [Candidatus Wolfebacteria bacterium]